MAFLKPAIDAIGVADNMKYKGKDFKNFGDHYKAIYEAATMMSWVTMSPPMGTPATHIQSQKDATDFNLLRIKKNKKDDKNKAFVKSFEDFHKAMAEYGKNYFKKDGFVWNPKVEQFLLFLFSHNFMFIVNHFIVVVVFVCIRIFVLGRCIGFSIRWCSSNKCSTKR